MDVALYQKQCFTKPMSLFWSSDIKQSLFSTLPVVILATLPSSGHKHVKVPAWWEARLYSLSHFLLFCTQWSMQCKLEYSSHCKLTLYRKVCQKELERQDLKPVLTGGLLLAYDRVKSQQSWLCAWSSSLCTLSSTHSLKLLTWQKPSLHNMKDKVLISIETWHTYPSRKTWGQAWVKVVVYWVLKFLKNGKKYILAEINLLKLCAWSLCSSLQMWILSFVSNTL